ncbi:FAD/NAD(P)-binding domain-protein [Lipomyces oligophaga]|uniref:FAD/NAD(P)-binding domain-protein n=1 Tax=Lipomyces oligophaga TaxID=45792 RepID=UPI0034CEE3DA
MAPSKYYDVVIIGAGFSGVYLTYQLRKLGFSVHVYDRAPSLGGTWRFSRYPGARVDSPVPIYEFAIPEIYNEWNWSERYPCWPEIQEYFEFVDRKLEISKDVSYNTAVTGASWSDNTQTWTTTLASGEQIDSQFFLPCIGFAAKKFIPDWPGFESFKGTVVHSTDWPADDVSKGMDILKGKKVAVIGTGSTGVQIIQESGQVSDELTVFQRTPNLCLPMQQKKLTPEQQDAERPEYPEIYKFRYKSFGGFPWTSFERDLFEDTPEEREKQFDAMYERGGFHFWIASYRDILSNKAANDEVYNYWQKRSAARVNDPEVAELLAPKVAPHPFGTKRPSLEQNYFEQFNKPNVHLVNVNKTPIEKIVPEGIVTADGKLHEVDLLILATGFDAVTGSWKLLSITGKNGITIADKWAAGTSTYLGLSVAGFPNMFYTYGPQAPTAFSNGPTCTQIQSDFIVETIRTMRENNIRSLDAESSAELDWTKDINESIKDTLFPLAKSWYMGANIPGKPIESLNFVKGIPLYSQILNDVHDQSLPGFIKA